MRKSLELAPRLAALGEADLAAEKQARSWMPVPPTTRTALDPSRWSPRARDASRWRMVEICNQARLLH